MSITYREIIYERITTERERQDEKWGSDRRPDSEPWVAILTEEVGEVARATLERKDLEEELIQVAAVCVAWLEALAKYGVPE